MLGEHKEVVLLALTRIKEGIQFFASQDDQALSIFLAKFWINLESAPIQSNLYMSVVGLRCK
jgi:hypothetical protein